MMDKPLVELEQATIGFCGDSGDGMQLVGTEFASASANLGNDISTFPDFPAEIRAPIGTLAGVSGFQVQFSSIEIYTPGDRLNALVAMNPAALKTRLKDVEPGGILVINKDAFGPADLRKANCVSNPLEDGSLAGYRVISIPLTALNREAVATQKLGTRDADRCKNFFALGLVFWLYERPLAPTLKWIAEKFGKKESVMLANSAALKAGYNYGETTELMPVHYHVAKAVLPPGKYRKITGNEALALGLVTAAVQSDTQMLFAGYPITPASDILHQLVGMKQYPVSCIQAEDEIAAVGMAIGAAFGGCLGVTATSGPGICLKSEGIGLAVMTELPLVVIDVQRGGPSTGLPTKTEQADLLQAMYGRNGECPVCIVAPCSPGDCFTMAVEAVRLAVGHMTPVLLLSDGYLANGAEPWLLPDPAKLPKIPIHHATGPNAGSNGDAHFLPYKRDDQLVRPWAAPGTPGLEHRIGGIEKEQTTGNVSYDPENHERMVKCRAQKIANIANDIPPLEVSGPAEGDLLVIGWGGTYGSITTAVQRAQRKRLSVAQAHLRYLNPMPRNTEEVLKSYKKVLIPELNGGQLAHLLRAAFLVDAVSLSKVQGRPFQVSDIETKIEELLGSVSQGL
jgi:2-oxoglutarate/2-oxoacid ferredoxin oxidoreductase subunit alpha